jgi:hypothetical protein
MSFDGRLVPIRADCVSAIPVNDMDSVTSKQSKKAGHGPF